MQSFCRNRVAFFFCSCNGWSIQCRSARRHLIVHDGDFAFLAYQFPDLSQPSSHMSDASLTQLLCAVKGRRFQWEVETRRLRMELFLDRSLFKPTNRAPAEACAVSPDSDLIAFDVDPEVQPGPRCVQFLGLRAGRCIRAVFLVTHIPQGLLLLLLAAQRVLNLLGMGEPSPDFASKDCALVIQHVRPLLARLVLFCCFSLVSLSVSCSLSSFMFETLSSGLTSLSAPPPGFQVTDADSWPQTCLGTGAELAGQWLATVASTASTT